MTSVVVDDFADFYAAHFHEIARQLYVYLDDHAEAQDIAQEAFSRAFLRWQKISGYEQPLAWVRTVAWNLATSRLRHLRVVWRHSAGLRAEHIDGPSPDRVALVEALKTLPSKHRLAVVLHHLAQMSAAEIAVQEGVAEGTVRSWLSRGRAKLATQLDDGGWREAEGVAFRPAGTGAIAREVKARRRLRQSGVAAAVAVVLAVALAVVLSRQGAEPPVIGPTTPPTSPSLPARLIRLPGTTFESMPRVSFADRNHGWLLYQRVIARTDDGGQSWRAVDPPQIVGDNVLELLGVEPDSAVLMEHERKGGITGYWVTRDRGNSFTWYPEKNPPVEALMANGGYRFFCPGQTGLMSDDDCQTVTLRHGRENVVTQPPLRDYGTNVFTSHDGRIWVVKSDSRAALTLIAVSEDGARTWRQLPALSARTGRICVSPDGTDVWFAGPSGYWQLESGQWQRRMAPAYADGPYALLDGGVWLIRRANVAGYLKDGVFTPVIEASSLVYDLSVLPDGTVLEGDEEGYILGLETGSGREWIRLRLQ